MRDGAFPGRWIGTALLLTGLVWADPAAAATITVSTTADENGSGAQCSVREAIQAANTDAAYGGCTAGSGADVIEIPAGTYTLTLPGAGEDTNAGGDLDIGSSLELRGAGRTTTVLDGGGLDRVLHVLSGNTVVIRDLTVTGVSVTGSGGGIFTSSNTTLEAVNVTYNTATGSGGGVAASYTGSTPLVIDRCILRGNTTSDAAQGGGGLYTNTANLTMTATSVIENTATAASGGGMQIVLSTATVRNTTVSGNGAQWHGGGISASFTTLTLTHDSIVYNVASLGNNGSTGGGFRLASCTTTIKNTILSENNVVGGTSNSYDCATSPALTSAGFNLVGVVGSACSGFGAADTIGLDPMLGPLGDYGGDTLLHPALPGSPAQDTGSCTDPGGADVLTDQRGAPRPSGAGCDVGAYELAPNLLFESTPEPAGANCADGGALLEIGEDDDYDGVLDPSEITSSAYVCNPPPAADGFPSLVRMEPVAVGDATCPDGGQMVLVGLDDGDGNGAPLDGVLDDDEVDLAPVWMCNGQTGGQGISTLLRVDAVAPGDTTCPNGGQEILVGLDDGDGNGTAADGVLDDDEVDLTPVKICNGIPGLPGLDGANGLIVIDDLPVGDASCPNGGYLLSFGLDNGDGNGLPSDGILDPDEQDAAPVALCTGLDGVSTLVRIEELPAGDANCAEGGQLILIGLDDGDGNGTPLDGVLDDDEVDGPPHYACNGDSGVVAHLLRVDSIPVGDATCPEGGQRVVGGLDDGDGNGVAGDGILQDGEIDSEPAVLCNGTTGSQGPAGGDSLVQITTLGVGDEHCPFGGEQLEVGADDDRDGLLDPEEVDDVFYVCDGDAGSHSLMQVTPLESGDEQCEWGGHRVDTGLDNDGDGRLSAGEITDTFYLCNGGNVPVNVEGGGGCATSGGSGGADLLLLGWLLWGWRRRRRG